MLQRYKVDLYSPENAYGESRVLATRTFRTSASAARCAVRWLRKRAVYATRYTCQRDLGRAASCRISDTRSRKAPEWISPDVVIVPSVGELGWTP